MAARKARELFIENLNALMKTAGIKNPAELAKRLEIDRVRVWSWTKGGSFPEIDQLDALADLFKVPVSRFFMDLSSPKSAGVDVDVVATMVELAIRKLKDDAQE